MRKPRVLCLLALSFALSAASNVFGQEPTFGLIDFPGASSTQAWGINARGEIVGAYNDGNPHGFYLHRGNYAPIDYPGATFTNALGISPRGEIVGRYVDASGRHGYVLRRGEFTTIDYSGATFTGPLQSTRRATSWDGRLLMVCFTDSC
jgi:uncharacterized membrane protein